MYTSDVAINTVSKTNIMHTLFIYFFSPHLAGSVKIWTLLLCIRTLRKPAAPLDDHSKHAAEKCEIEKEEQGKGSGL